MVYDTTENSQSLRMLEKMMTKEDTQRNWRKTTAGGEFWQRRCHFKPRVTFETLRGGSGKFPRIVVMPDPRLILSSRHNRGIDEGISVRGRVKVDDDRVLLDGPKEV